MHRKQTGMLFLSVGCVFAQATITTVAGRDPKFEGAGGPGVEARIGLPRGIALDGKGNVFFTDSGFSLVLKIDAKGQLSVLADATQVIKPKGIAVDSGGNVYVADSPAAPQTGPRGDTILAPSGRIRKIAPDGSVTTVAGAGADPDSEDIPAAQSRLSSATGLAMDSEGNLYVAETWSNRVRRISREGNIRTVAGNGKPGFGPPPADVGDGGPAINATLRAPIDVSVDREGGLLIADWQNYRIRRVDREGVIRTVVGGARGPLDEGVAVQMDLDGPCGIVAAPDGGFYLFDWYVITRVTPDGIARRITNWSGGPEIGDGRPASEIYVPGSVELSGMAADAAGNLYFADVNNSRVRRIGADGIVTTLAGTSPFRFGGDGGPAVEALLNAPNSLAVSDGTVHVLERANCRVRSIDPEGAIRTIAGNGICITGIDPRTSDKSETAVRIGLGGAFAVAAGGGGSVYLADGNRIRVITPDGLISNVVNRNGMPGGFGDVAGPAIDTRIAGPIFGLYADREGNLFFADSPSNRVRIVTPDGMISTFAGSGPAPGPPVFAGDGSPAIEARLSQPTAITGDSEGNIYILDTGNRRIRKVAKDGVITTVAGNGQVGFSGDSGPAVEAAFNPFGAFGSAGIAVDSEGNLYLADPGNHRIRRVTPDGIISTIAGTGEPGFDGDGGAPENARLNSPSGLAVDEVGNLYVADSGNHRVRKITFR